MIYLESCIETLKKNNDYNYVLTSPPDYAELGIDPKTNEWEDFLDSWISLLNPINNKKALYFGSHTVYVKDMDKKESKTLLDYLINFSTQNKFIYSHNWKKNDLIIWDNRSMLHRGQSYNPTEPRYLIRTTVMDSTARATYLK